jgi:hypothetical protein
MSGFGSGPWPSHGPGFDRVFENVLRASKMADVWTACIRPTLWRTTQSRRSFRVQAGREAHQQSGNRQASSIPVQLPHCRWLQRPCQLRANETRWISVLLATSSCHVWGRWQLAPDDATSERCKVVTHTLLSGQARGLQKYVLWFFFSAAASILLKLYGAVEPLV